MNKKDLIENVAKKANIQKKIAREALDSFLDCISQALAKGQTVTLVNFGTFSPTPRAPRKGRNPRTGDIVEIPGVRAAKFKAGKGLKGSINR